MQPILNTYNNKYHIIQTEAHSGDPYAGIIVLVDKRFTLTNENVLLPGRLINFNLKTCKRFIMFQPYTDIQVARQLSQK